MASSGATGLAAITQGLSGPASSLVAQGQSIYSQADALSKGDYSGLAVAASGLIADLPPGQIQNALTELEGAGEGALTGAAVGSILGPEGTAIGAVIGALVGFVESIVSNPPVIENDPRPSGEAYIIPATAQGAPFSVIPYNYAHPRVVGIPSGGVTGFYQIPNDNRWTPDFSYGVTWSRPPQTALPNPSSQGGAWNLVKWYVGIDSIAKAYCKDPTLAQNVSQARTLFGTLVGSDRTAQTMFQRMVSLFGEPSSFKAPQIKTPAIYDALFPSLAFLTASSAAIEIVGANGGLKSPAQIAASLSSAAAYPFDYTYYLGALHYDNQDGTMARAYGSGSNAPNAAAWFADTLDFAIAECIVLNYSDVNILHFLLSLGWLHGRGMLYDVAQYGPQSKQLPVNLARLIGIAANRVKNATPKVPHAIGKAGSATQPLTHKGKIGYTGNKYGVEDIALIGAGGLGLWGLSKLIRR